MDLTPGSLGSKIGDAIFLLVLVFIGLASLSLSLLALTRVSDHQEMYDWYRDQVKPQIVQLQEMKKLKLMAEAEMQAKAEATRAAATPKPE